MPTQIDIPQASGRNTFRWTETDYWTRTGPGQHWIPKRRGSFLSGPEIKLMGTLKFIVGGDDTSGVVMVGLTAAVGASETEVITPLAIQDRKMPNMKCQHV